MMGLHTSTAKVAPKMGTRLPYPSIISWENSFAIVKESNANFLEIVGWTSIILVVILGVSDKVKINQRYLFAGAITANIS